MGYTTDFNGHFKLSRSLTKEEKNYINEFSNTRRMKRNTKELLKKYKGKYGFNGSYGNDGEYFIGGDEKIGIINFNIPPGQTTYEKSNFNTIWDENLEKIEQGKCQPGLWCQWIITDDDKLEWNGSEKFYNYVEWLNYMINHFFNVWNVQLNGEILYDGESDGDEGNILAVNSIIYKDVNIKDIRKMKLDDIEDNLDT